MKLLVAIHDVTPALAAEVMALWEQCRSIDIVPALFVVPQWHGWAHLAPRAPFTQWLRQAADDGAEIFLHGWRHDEWETPRAMRDFLAAAGRTQDEAEFLSMSRADATLRIRLGLEQLRSCGLDPRGFVAPAWLAPAWLTAAAAAAGLRLGEDAIGVTAHEHGATARLVAPAVRWSGRTAFRAYASVGVARVRRRWHLAYPYVRLALHPKDLHHPMTRDSLARELLWWGSVRQQIGYAEAMGRGERDLRRAG